MAQENKEEKVIKGTLSRCGCGLRGAAASCKDGKELGGSGNRKKQDEGGVRQAGLICSSAGATRHKSRFTI